MRVDSALDTIPLNECDWERCSLDVSARCLAAETLDRPPFFWIQQAAQSTVLEAPAKYSFAVNRKSPQENVGHISPSVADFVKQHFIPEHVAIKRYSGRAHFYAILKHVLSPEEVDRITGRPSENDRAKLIPHPRVALHRVDAPHPSRC